MGCLWLLVGIFASSLIPSEWPSWVFWVIFVGLCAADGSGHSHRERP